MKEIIALHFEEYIEYEECFVDKEKFFEEITQEIYNSENNFNNADTTSNQRCFTEHEIKQQVKEYWPVWSWDNERCQNCGMNLIEEEDYITDHNPVPYGDTTVYENLVSGYNCRNCGHTEKW
jgi:hypothetical protein